MCIFSQTEVNFFFFVYMARQKLKKYPDWQALICDYVREYGKLDGCVDVLPQKFSLQSVKNALDDENKTGLYLPEFAKKVEKALEEYKVMHVHPSEDPEFRKDVFSQMKAMAKAGRSNEGTFEYNEHQKMTRKVYRQAGIDKWLYEAAFPVQTFTEDAILIVVSNQLQTLGTDEIPEEERQVVMRWLTTWQRRAVEELQKMGLSTKKLRR